MALTVVITLDGFRKSEKREENMCCCHNLEAVFIVQGLYPNIENSQKSRKNCQKIRKKYAKSKSDILCCHDNEGAVFRVQGPYLNIEQSQKMAEKSEKNRQQIKTTLFVATMLKWLCSGFRVHI